MATERDAFADHSRYFVETSRTPVLFDPVNEQTLLFDEVHKHVLFCTDGKVSWLPYYPPRTRSRPITISYAGKILNAKLSVDAGVICYQTSPVELVFHSCTHENEFRLSCQKIASGNVILCFMWTHINECFVVTKLGVDLYKVNPAKGTIKLQKSKSVHVMWHSYSHENRVLLVGHGPNGSSVNAYHFPPSEIVKLPKLELEVNPTIIVQGNDIVVSQIYGVLYCIHLNHLQRRICLYQIGRDDVRLYKAYSISSGFNYTCNVIDNVLVVHSPSEKISYAFDIKTSATSAVGQPSPILFKQLSAAQSSNTKWEFYQPSFVFNPVIGFLSELKLNVTALAKGYENKHLLVPFLLRRTQGKHSVLKLIKECVDEEENLSEIQKLFDTLNKVYRSALGESMMRESRRLQSGARRNSSSMIKPSGNLTLSARFFEDSLLLGRSGTHGLEAPSKSSTDLLVEIQRAEEMTARNGNPASQDILKDAFVIVDQIDIHQHILLPFMENEAGSPKYKIAVCMEYIRSLTNNELKVNPIIYNCVVDMLIKFKEHYTLHQFLQHRLLADSMYIAHQLLSIEESYPPAFSLALDMMKRIALTDIIFDTLISRDKLTPALRFATYYKLSAFVPRKLLNTALSTGSDTLFYHTYRWVFDRIEANRYTGGSPADDLADFTHTFQQKFPPKTT